jgi:glutathione S-transferase
MYIIESRPAPNPRRVRIFLAEKGVGVRYEQRDLMAGELKSSIFTALNPWQRVPVLILDDGRAISETMAICRYFEALHAEPRLFGHDAVAQAEIEMWQRRMELNLLHGIAQVMRHLNPKMAHLEVPQISAWGDANKARVADDLSRLDQQLRDNPYVAGEHFSVADITALVAIDFMKPARLTMPSSLGHIARWYGEVSARPSAAA